MTSELKQLELLLFNHFGLQFSNCTKEEECEEYMGFNCCIETIPIKFRKAKVTPKKNGQFVTLWRRNEQKTTEPFTANAPFEFFIIVTATTKQLGCFIFPKHILVQQNILSTTKKEGKRGFRIYPEWDIPTSNQAKKTKLWQNNYFINLNELNDVMLQKAKSILDIR